MSLPAPNPLPVATTPAAPGPDCWNRVGIAGDRSCPELAEHTHCRNCPTYAEAARSFFERPAPPGYLEEWRQALASPPPHQERKDLSVLIFRVAGEWLAWKTRVALEVTPPSPVHRIPHRSNDLLSGLVNLRGQLQLLVSLGGLLRIDGASGPAGPPETRRFVVVKLEGRVWVFLADEVVGVRRVVRSQLLAVPANLTNPAHSHTEAVIPWEGRSVGLLDERRVGQALAGLNA